MDNDACGAGGVTVSWERAVSWGTGGSGTYALYRDSVPGFTPSGANLVASGIETLSYNDLTAPSDQTLYYIARAENDESCSTGPNNGGAIDHNLVDVAVAESTTQPIPPEILTLRADFVNHAHVKLHWNSVSSATSYRVYRSDLPQPGTFVQIGETESVSFEDLDQGNNENSYYYVVRPVNACDQEGP
jgi:fibronectin type 3 domain-containing protein